VLDGAYLRRGKFFRSHRHINPPFNPPLMVFCHLKE